MEEFELRFEDVKAQKGEQGPPGEPGPPGPPGNDGRDGHPGKDGRGIDKITDEDGDMVVHYTNGDTQTVGPYPQDGKDGRGIILMEQIAPDRLLVRYTDGESDRLELPEGPPGRPGEQGPPGERGPAGNDAEVDDLKERIKELQEQIGELKDAVSTLAQPQDFIPQYKQEVQVAGAKHTIRLKQVTIRYEPLTRTTTAIAPDGTEIDREQKSPGHPVRFRFYQAEN